MSLINSLKLVVKPLRVLIDNNSRRIDGIESKSITAPESIEVVNMLAELDVLPAITDSRGAIYTDENGSILVM